MPRKIGFKVSKPNPKRIFGLLDNPFYLIFNLLKSRGEP